MILKKVFFALLFLSTTISYGQNLLWPYGRIHCFGDSHGAHFFTNCKNFQEYVALKIESKINPKDPEFQYEKSIYPFSTDEGILQIPFGVHWLGARTMHRIGRDGIDAYAYDVKPNDILVFVFGEIDVRVHIGKQMYIKNRQLDEIIETLAQNYINAIRKNQQRFNCKCVIVAIIPPMHPTHTLEAKDELYLASVPIFERIVFTKNLNQKLSLKCKQSDVLFLPLPEVLENPNGSFDLFYADTGEHLHPKYNYLIKNKLIHILLNN